MLGALRDLKRGATSAGGAERLVVDAAVGLQKLGHHVEIFTSFHDGQRCFRETRDGTLQVHVLGDSLVPRSVAGRLTIVCAILRQLCLVASLLSSLLLAYMPAFATSRRPTRHSHDWPWLRATPAFDVYFVDQLSVCIPLLRWLANTRVLFYCHFPDLLMNPDRTGKSSVLRRLYRLPFDRLEEATTEQADKILVNSEFTSRAFHRTFASLNRIPRVVYPGIDVATFDQPPSEPLLGERRILLSVNRFERKKGLRLALDAFAALADAAAGVTLVFVGGYDDRLADNVETLAALERACADLELSYVRLPEATHDALASSTAAVVFLPDLAEDLKARLMRAPTTAALLYTPTDEHLGIVPLEAMASGLPVLACDSGGPLETVEDPTTGRLRRPETQAWTEALRELLALPAEERRAMADAGRARVRERFALELMARELDRALRETRAYDAERGPVNREPSALLAAMVVVVGLTCLGISIALLIGPPEGAHLDSVRLPGVTLYDRRGMAADMIRGHRRARAAKKGRRKKA